MLPVRFPGCLHLEKTQYEQSSPVFAFTLIELLIVIAIILILVSIALPNFLDAQLRAQVTKVKGELRGIGEAMEAYHLDFGDYPASQREGITRVRELAGLFWLTSPTKHIYSVPSDPFSPKRVSSSIQETPYLLSGIKKGGATNPESLITWVLYSYGPDSKYSEYGWYGAHYSCQGECSDSYCPTNGTRSLGDIFLWGGDPFWVGVMMQEADMAAYVGPPPCGIFDVGKCVDNVWYYHTLPPSLR